MITFFSLLHFFHVLVFPCCIFSSCTLSFCTFFIFHSFRDGLSLCCTIFMLFFLCCTLLMSDVLNVWHSFRVTIFLCCTFFHFFRVAHFLVLTFSRGVFFMFHCFYILLFLCCTLCMLLIYRVGLFTVAPFPFCNIFMLLFCVAIFSCYILVILHSFHVALSFAKFFRTGLPEKTS